MNPETPAVAHADGPVPATTAATTPSAPADGLRAATVWWAPLTLADVRLLDLLPPGERARVDRAEQAADRARRLLGAAVLRCAVAHRTGTDPRAVRIDRTCSDCGAQHGRPRVIDHDLFVSVSHSGLLSVVALSERPVGIDVQRDADLDAATPDAPTDVATWVRTEAVFKSGLGSAANLTELHPPVHGHTAAIATADAVVVDERDARDLLD